MERSKTSSRRNLVVVILDSVRKDFFDRHAIRLRELADVSYEQCRAASSWSTPSHASMFSGRLPSDHGIHTHARDFSLLSEDETFLADLEGYTKVGVSANAFASASYNFDQYFDVFKEPSATRRFSEGLDPGELVHDIDSRDPRRYFRGVRAILSHDNPGRSLANAALGEFDNLLRNLPVPQPFDDGAKPVLRTTKRLVRRNDEPLFVFMNLMETHIPLRPTRGFDPSLYDVPNGWCSDEKGVWELMNAPNEDYWEAREGVYAAAIDYLDRQLASFIDWLENGTRHETTVIVTSDHGENHGRTTEKGLANHKSSLSEALLHVPFEVINPPGHRASITGLVSHLAFGELLIGLADDALPDITRETVAAEVAGLSAGPDPPSDREYWDRAIRCAYRGRDKYVWDSLGNRDRYRLDPDRPSWQEHVEQVERVPSWATDEFDEDITTFKDRAVAIHDDSKVDKATEQRLRRLGYLD